MGCIGGQALLESRKIFFILLVCREMLSFLFAFFGRFVERMNAFSCAECRAICRGFYGV